MHFSKSLVVAMCATAGNAYQTRFFPDAGGLQQSSYVTPIGMNYNLSDSQVLAEGSFWSSSYVHGSDDHEYLILSHFVGAGSTEYYRASILDITDPSSYNQFVTLLVNQTSNFVEGTFGYKTDDFFMGAVGNDTLGKINTWSTKEGVTFNLTYDLTSPLLLNGGAGVIFWEDALLTNEWSSPANPTTGTLNVNGTTVDVMSDSSFTWYDRQWQQGAATNWTWFELHLDSAQGQVGEKISNWFYPSGYGPERGFATIRSEPGNVNSVIAAELVRGDRTWTSPYGPTYILDYTIKLADGTVLNVTNIAEDQELADPTGTILTYEGFVNVVGERKNGQKVTGYGLVEILPYGH